MYGAILGDIVGSPYEFDCNNYKAKDFPLFSRRSDFTDDTVMTLAVAKALLSTRGQNDAAIKTALVREMQRQAALPDRGYGIHFGGWLYGDDPQPYQAPGGSGAMRVSSAAPFQQQTQRGASSGAAHRRSKSQPPRGHQGRAGCCGGDLSRSHRSRKSGNQGVCGVRVTALRLQSQLQ